MSQKLPFTFTPNITRYLEEVIGVYEMHVQGVPKDFQFTPFTHYTHTYINRETFYSFSEANRLAFVKHVGKNNAVVITDRDEGDDQQPFEDKSEYRFLELDDPEMAKGFGHHPWDIGIEVNDIRPLLNLWRTYQFQTKEGSAVFVSRPELEETLYDFDTGRLTCHKLSHNFRKGVKNAKKDPSKTRVFEVLWNYRRHFAKGKQTEEGKPIALANIKKYLGKPLSGSLPHNIVQPLRDKGFNIHIEKHDDKLLLVVNENS